MPTPSSKYLRTTFVVGLFVILCIGGFTYKHINELSQTSKEVKKNGNTTRALPIFDSNLRLLLFKIKIGNNF